MFTGGLAGVGKRGVNRCAKPRSIEYYTEYATRYGDRMSVRHALLALLSEGPKYGLQLREEFEARTGEVWPLNVGQVYTTLQRLERDGLVESDDDGQDGPQKGFRITAAGAHGADRMAAHAVGHELAAAGRAGDEDPGGAAGARHRRAGRDPGAPQVPGGADAAMDADQGVRGRVRHEPGAGGGRGTVPARRRGPLAGRRRRPHQAGAPTRRQTRGQRRQRGRHRPYRRCGAGLEQEDERAGDAARVTYLRPGGRRGACAERD